MSKARVHRSLKHQVLRASIGRMDEMTVIAITVLDLHAAALTRCSLKTPPRDADEVSLEAGEDERIAKYEPTDTEDHCPTDTEDEEIVLLQPIMNLVTEDVRGAIMAHDVEICRLVRELGGTKRSYARERAGAIKAMVAEIYSPPRVTNCAKLLPGY